MTMEKLLSKLPCLLNCYIQRTSLCNVTGFRLHVVVLTVAFLLKHDTFHCLVCFIKAVFELCVEMCKRYISKSLFFCFNYD